MALVPLRNKKTFRTVLPSKIFENAACGKPILLGVAGESKELIEGFEAGLAFEPENVSEFLLKLQRLKGDIALYERLVQGAKALARSFDRRKFATQLLYIFMGVQKRRNALQRRQFEISGMQVNSSEN